MKLQAVANNPIRKIAVIVSSFSFVLSHFSFSSVQSKTIFSQVAYCFGFMLRYRFANVALANKGKSPHNQLLLRTTHYVLCRKAKRYGAATNENYMKRVLLILVFISIYGCAASGPIFSKVETVPPGKSAIYFYRENTVILSGVGAYFYINDEKVSKLSKNGYSSHIVPSGQHVVKMSWNCSLGACLYASSLKNKPEKNINLSQGQSVFFKLEVDGSLMGDTIVWSFDQVDESRALSELSSARAQK